MRRNAARALGELGRAEEPVMEGLLGLARDEGVDTEVCSAAVRSLGDLGRAEEHVVEGLLGLARDEGVDYEVRHAAYESLKRLVSGVATD